MTTDLEAICRVIEHDFPAAVKAANKAQVAALDNVLSAVDDAAERYRQARNEARKMQEDAARIAAESIRMIERADEAYWKDMRAAKALLNELRGPAPVPMIQQAAE